MKRVKLPSGSILEIADNVSVLDALVDVFVQLEMVKGCLEKLDFSGEELADLINKVLSEDKEDLSKFKDIKIN